METRMTGPATYFPSIERKYGRSIDDWRRVMRAGGMTSHKQLVEWLKREHGLGHGHARALAADLLGAHRA